jgi:hypothetical protein
MPNDRNSVQDWSVRLINYLFLLAGFFGVFRSMVVADKGHYDQATYELLMSFLFFYQFGRFKSAKRERTNDDQDRN